MPVTVVVIAMPRKVSGKTRPSSRNAFLARPRGPPCGHQRGRRHDMSMAVTVVRITGGPGQILGSASEDRGLCLAHTG